MYMCIYIYIYIYVSISLSLYIYVYIHYVYITDNNDSNNNDNNNDDNNNNRILYSPCDGGHSGSSSLSSAVGVRCELRSIDVCLSTCYALLIYMYIYTHL